MGLMDKAKEAAQSQIAARGPQPSPPPAAGGCPQARPHYLTEVNKGSINMGRWQSSLTDMHARGYRLAHVLEQDGNTVQVFEHRHP